jgi:hypothetical protein
MAEYSKIARGSFVTSGTPTYVRVNLPYQPQRVELLNYTAFSAPSQFAVARAWWDIAMGQNNTAFEYISAASAPWNLAVDYTTQGVSTYAGALSLQLGPQLQINGITKASPAVVSTSAANTLATGQVVILEGLYQSSTTGMPQLSNMPFTITVVNSSSFSINWNTNQSNYTALSGNPSGAYVRQVLNPYLYLPGVNFISEIATGTTTTITTTTDHNYVVGQEIAFRIPSVYGTTGLNSLPNVIIPGSPIYGYVTAVTANNIFVCNIDSSAFSAFNTNQTVASVPGLQMPQVVAVGDVNSGGAPYSGGALYPSPSFPTYTGGAATINGPAIQGAFVNNTNQGFIIQNGAGAVQSSATLLTASSTYIWTATYYDLSY